MPLANNIIDDMEKNQFDGLEALLCNQEVSINELLEYNALIWAAYHGNNRVISLLLDNKIDIYYKEKETGITALHMALGNGQGASAYLILQHAINTEPERIFELLTIKDTKYNKEPFDLAINIAEPGKKGVEVVLLKLAQTLIEKRIIESDPVKRTKDLDEVFFLKLFTSLSYFLKASKTHSYKRHLQTHKIYLTLACLYIYSCYKPEAKITKILQSWEFFKIRKDGTIELLELARNLQSIMIEIENSTDQYFGSYLSDDSDDEFEWQSYIDDARNEFIGKISNKISESDSEDVSPLSVFSIDKNDVQKISYSIFKKYVEKIIQDIMADQTDLESLNSNVESEIRAEEELIKDFSVPLFRGISYLDDRWNKKSRDRHRKIDFTTDLAAKYSESSLFSETGYSFYLQQDAYVDLLANPGAAQALRHNSRELKRNLLKLRNTYFIAAKIGSNYYFFDNFLDFMQHAYTNGIVRYLKFLEIISSHPQWSRIAKLFPSQGNYFVSFGELPYHCCRYAFGLKNPYSEFSLQPRWDKEGRPERPHVGRLYHGLYPIQDFNKLDAPNHIRKMKQQGQVSAGQAIGAELEVSFLSHLPNDPIFAGANIRFPSLKKYVPQYATKYGLDKKTFKLFKEAILLSKNHSYKSKLAQACLMEWLCIFHALSAMQACVKELKLKNSSKQQRLVFLDQLGGFTSQLPAWDRSRLDITAEKEALAKKIFQKNIGKVFPEIKEAYKDTAIIREVSIEEVNSLNPELLQHFEQHPHLKRSSLLALMENDVNENSFSSLSDSMHVPYDLESSFYAAEIENNAAPLNIFSDRAMPNLMLSPIKAKTDDILAIDDEDVDKDFVVDQLLLSLSALEINSASSADDPDIDIAALESQRSITTICINNANKECIVVPAKSDGNCGFTAIRQVLVLSGYKNELTDRFFREEFISLMRTIVNDSIRYKTYQPYIDNIFQFDKASDLDDWCDKFKSTGYWMEDAHFRFVSHYFNLRLNFYYVSAEVNKSAFEPEPTYESIYEGTDENNAITVALAHVKSGLAKPLNHFDSIIIEPTQEQKEQISYLANHKKLNDIQGAREGAQSYNTLPVSVIGSFEMKHHESSKSFARTTSKAFIGSPIHLPSGQMNKTVAALKIEIDKLAEEVKELITIYNIKEPAIGFTISIIMSCLDAAKNDVEGSNDYAKLTEHLITIKVYKDILNKHIDYFQPRLLKL